MAPCLVPPASGGWLHGLVVGVFAVCAVSLYVWLTWSLRRGLPWRSGAVSLLASPLPMLWTATVWEGRNFWVLLDPTRQSLALMFGDALLVPVIMTLAAVVWRDHIRAGSWWRSPWWALLSGAFGIAVAVKFRIDESHVYNALRLQSPSKLAHDFIAYPVLAAALLYVLLPLLVAIWQARGRRARGRAWWLAILAVALIVAFAVLLVLASKGLDPTFLHPQWDWTTRAVIHCQP